MWNLTKVAVVITAFVIGMWTGGAYAQDLPHERIGTSKMKHKSLPNALVAAHFHCNRKGLWANLDTAVVGNTVSDRSKRPTYRTTVRFECSPNYTKNLPENRNE
jgi:hypothetical protein